MKYQLPTLDALKVFEAAARLLSFSQAAQDNCQLQVFSATVFR